MTKSFNQSLDSKVLISYNNDHFFMYLLTQFQKVPMFRFFRELGQSNRNFNWQIQEVEIKINTGKFKKLFEK